MIPAVRLFAPTHTEVTWQLVVALVPSAELDARHAPRVLPLLGGGLLFFGRRKLVLAGGSRFELPLEQRTREVAGCGQETRREARTGGIAGGVRKVELVVGWLVVVVVGIAVGEGSIAVDRGDPATWRLGLCHEGCRELWVRCCQLVLLAVKVGLGLPLTDKQG